VQLVRRVLGVDLWRMLVEAVATGPGDGAEDGPMIDPDFGWWRSWISTA
jgi:hypothetical protein